MTRKGALLILITFGHPSWHCGRERKGRERVEKGKRMKDLFQGTLFPDFSLLFSFGFIFFFTSFFTKKKTKQEQKKGIILEIPFPGKKKKTEKKTEQKGGCVSLKVQKGGAHTCHQMPPQHLNVKVKFSAGQSF